MSERKQPTLEEVFRSEYTNFVRQTIRKGTHPNNAEDVVQEAFSRVFKHPPRSNENLAGYTSRAVSTIGIDNWRRTQTPQGKYDNAIAIHELYDSHVPIGSSSSVDVFDAAIANDPTLLEQIDKIPAERRNDVIEDFISGIVEEDLREGLKKMDPIKREALLLVTMCGLSYEEIAAVQGIKIGTVRSRINRGKAELKTYLE